MQTRFDCIPCFIRQTLDTLRIITSDETIHEHVLKEVLSELSSLDLNNTPPAISQKIHHIIRRHTKERDPYKAHKERSNRLGLKLYPWMKSYIQDIPNSKVAALQLAIAGNVIDFGVCNQINESDIHRAIERALTTHLKGNEEEFFNAVNKAEKILYLADNSGEIVFDKLLIENLPKEKITLAVRGAPIINDVTMQDAEAVGITRLVNVIDNGDDVPGTVLSQCSELFRKTFDEADLIIAKGQGNYETLSDEKKDIFFLLKAKCEFIADHLNCQKGEFILERSSYGNTLDTIIEES